MNEADDAFDVITLIMVLAIFTPIMIYCAMPFFKGDVGGFGVQIEKAALATKSEIIPIERPITTDDIMLMLVVADSNTPSPKKIRLSPTGIAGPHTEFLLDDIFFANKALKLQEAKAALPAVPAPFVHLTLYSGISNASDLTDLTGMRFWDMHP